MSSVFPSPFAPYVTTENVASGISKGNAFPTYICAEKRRKKRGKKNKEKEKKVTFLLSFFFLEGKEKMVVFIPVFQKRLQKEKAELLR